MMNNIRIFVYGSCRFYAQQLTEEEKLGVGGFGVVIETNGKGATSISEKMDKRLWHRAFRRENNTLAQKQILLEDEITFPVMREKFDTWSMSKDGKIFYFTEAELRKKLDSAIREVKNQGFTFRYRSGIWLLEKMCDFLNIPKTNKAVSHVRQKDINRFLLSFVNKEKSK